MFDFGSKRYQFFFIVSWISIISSILIFGWSTTWSALGIPSMFPEFSDMRTVQGALYSLSEGFDPQTNNVGDPWGRSMNYPSIWISISEIFNLKIELHFKIFVSLMVFLFLGSCFLMVKQYPSLTLLFLCFSGATLLAVERGNNDILVFSLMYFSVFVGGGSYVIGLLIATLLKIFPILAFPAFCHSFKTFFLMFVVAIIALVILFPEFSNIRTGTPISHSLSYGSPSISAAFQGVLNFNFPAYYISILMLVTALMAWRLEFISKRLAFSEIDSRAKQMFLIGAYIYVGTFILSSNWDYRLIFLILCVPYAMSANDRYVRILLSISLIIAFNQIPLTWVLGTIGAALNILSKSLLAVFFTLAILMDLRTRSFMIFK